MSPRLYFPRPAQTVKLKMALVRQSQIVGLNIMVELQKILELWDTARNEGETCVLATVVKTQGSSYRLPGARMLLTSGGRRAGSISGGCLEDDLVKRAWWLTENGPVIRRYDTTADGEISTGYGLGCNGIIHVLLQRVSSQDCRILDLLRDVRFSRIPASVTHVLAPATAVGTRFHEEQSATDITIAEDSFTEHLVPPVQLLLCGAGDDAAPLNRLAQFLGWEVHVYDGRAHYARPERFPGSRQVTVRLPEGALHYPNDPWTVAVIMTHSYSQDLVFLRELSQLALSYLGILGPQKRTHQLLQDADLPARIANLELHAPMGLDIGADGPEQVALAIVAEIQACRNRRDGGQLRHRSGSIHAGTHQDQDAYIPSLTCV